MSFFGNIFKKFKSKEEIQNRKINPSVKRSDPSVTWENVGVLGDGAFGKVYQTRNIINRNFAALKQVEIDQYDDIEDFMVEIDILSSCRHKNIVQLIESYFFDSKISVYIEFCEVGAIDNVMLDLDKPLTEAQICYVCREMCVALEFLHANNVIHRDLKAGNILLNLEGSVKLADFGVSARLTEKERRDSFIGTPYWMAPEVIACENFKDSPYNMSADIWSFGVTLIECAQMRPPYHDMHPMRVLIRVQKSDPPTLFQPRLWSQSFNDFLAQCLVKNPQERSSAQELLQHAFIRDVTHQDKKAIDLLICESRAEVIETAEDTDDPDPSLMNTSSSMGSLDNLTEEDETTSKGGNSSGDVSSVKDSIISEEDADAMSNSNQPIVCGDDNLNVVGDQPASLDLKSASDKASNLNRPITPVFDNLNVVTDQPASLNLAITSDKASNSNQPMDVASASQYVETKVENIEDFTENKPGQSKEAAMPSSDVSATSAGTSESSTLSQDAPLTPVRGPTSFSNPSTSSSSSTELPRKALHTSLVSSTPQVEMRKKAPMSLPSMNSPAETRRTLDSSRSVLEEPCLDAKSNIAKFESMLATQTFSNTSGLSSSLGGRPSSRRVVSAFLEKRASLDRDQPSVTPTQENAKSCVAEKIRSFETLKGSSSSNQSETNQSFPGQQLPCPYSEPDMALVVEAIMGEVLSSENRTPSIPAVVLEVMEDLINGRDTEDVASTVTDIDSILTDSQGQINGPTGDQQKSNGHLQPMPKSPNPNHGPQPPLASDQVTVSGYGVVSVRVEMKRPEQDTKQAQASQLGAELNAVGMETANQKVEDGESVESDSMVRKNKPDRRHSHYRTLTKTRKFVVDGQEITTSTKKVVVKGQETLNEEDFKERKQEVRDHRLLVKEENRQYQALTMRAETELDQMEQKLKAEELSLQRSYELETEKLMQHQKTALEKVETQKEVELKQAMKKIKTDHVKEERQFRDTLRSKLSEAKAAAAHNLDRSEGMKKKDAVRAKREQLEAESNERLRQFRAGQEAKVEDLGQSLRQTYRVRVAEMEKEFLRHRHQMRLNHETARWTMEERHLHMRHQTARSQLSDLFVLKRQQIGVRQDRESAQLMRSFQREQEVLTQAQAAERRSLPKHQKIVSRQRISMFRESLRLRGGQFSVEEEKEKLRAFDEAEKARMRADIERLERKHRRKLEEMKQEQGNKRRELEGVQAEVKKSVLEQEMGKTKELEELFKQELHRFKARVQERKIRMENEFEQEMSRQESFYRASDAGHNGEVGPLQRRSMHHVTDLDSVPLGSGRRAGFPNSSTF